MAGNFDENRSCRVIADGDDGAERDLRCDRAADRAKERRAVETLAAELAGRATQIGCWRTGAQVGVDVRLRQALREKQRQSKQRMNDERSGRALAAEEGHGGAAVYARPFRARPLSFFHCANVPEDDGRNDICALRGR